MVGLGTIINVCGVLLGGLLGIFGGKLIKEHHQDALTKICGVCVLFIGIGGALEEMLTVSGSSVSSGKSMFVVISLALGALIGELLNIEHWFERFGEWLKEKSGNAKDKNFVEGFVTSSLTICIGAMAIVGAIEDGISKDYSVLAVKAVLDLIIILVLTASLGKGCIFSAIPVAIFQGLITVLATFIKPIMTETALSNLSLIGSILIFCVGLNLVWGKKIRVANLLPAIIIAVIIAFLPVNI